ncbi:MAG: DUF72 domain-containing protein [Acidimicrobiales bacterium]
MGCSQRAPYDLISAGAVASDPTDRGLPDRLRIGCAMWAHPPRRHRYGIAPGGELAWYGRRFTTVEGNTTFYAASKPETVERWAQQAPSGMRFCFAASPPHPRTATPQHREAAGRVPRHPRSAGRPPRSPPSSTPRLVRTGGPRSPGRLLDSVVGRTHGLDVEPAWAVEVRHPEFSPGGRSERLLNDALAARAVNRVILDSRALFAAPR